MFRMNPLMKVDSYKHSHWALYPEGMTNTYFYLESRGGRYGTTPFFGLQGFCLDNLVGEFVTKEDVEYAAPRLERHGVPCNVAGWMRIVERHAGKLPILIKAAPEGTIVPTQQVPITVESLDPELAWLPGWVETMLMRGVWYPTTVATKSYYAKKVIHRYLSETANAPMEELPFKLHDFGGRGTSSGESAAIGGAAHLVNFKGTDTLEGLEWMAHHYGDGKDGIPGFSIPALEHSVLLAHGPGGEVDAFRQALARYARPGKLVACVSDTYDYFNVVENLWGGDLKDEVIASGATIVIRPDSGIPSDIVLKTMMTLERKLGCEKNLRGSKVLPGYYRIIQGDGNDDEESIEDILYTLKHHGYSASNVAFGMGGGLLQKLDRDTQQVAYKLSEVTVAGVTTAVRKAPKTDSNKASKAGRFSLVQQGDTVKTIIGTDHANGNLLESVFENGAMTRNQTIDDIRARAGKEFC